jgi:hypothetical protein
MATYLPRATDEQLRELFTEFYGDADLLNDLTRNQALFEFQKDIRSEGYRD